MITTIIIVLLCCFLLATFAWFALRYPTPVGGDDLYKQLLPISLPAFLNLVDPAQKRFLRHHLLPVEYRKLSRQRTQIALRYTRRISHNTALFTRWADSARVNAPDPATAAAAAEMAALGVRTRFYVLAVLLLLYVEYIYPDLVELKDLVRRYELLASRQRTVAAASRC